MSAVAQERSFSASLEQQKNEAMDLDRKGGDYNVLERQAESDRQLWQSLLTQQKELQVVSNSRSNNVQVHGPRGGARRAVLAQHAARSGSRR